jgi:hypothetical protein
VDNDQPDIAYFLKDRSILPYNTYLTVLAISSALFTILTTQSGYPELPTFLRPDLQYTQVAKPTSMAKSSTKSSRSLPRLLLTEEETKSLTHVQDT